MTCFSVNDNFIVAARNLLLDYYDYHTHKIITLSTSEETENDCIVDITVSGDQKYIAVITSISKNLVVFSSCLEILKKIILPRSASKIRFTQNNKHILVADKSGDALLYNLEDEGKSGIKLLGHLSILLDILQTIDEKYIITCDRDEKIRISCYPNTYNIETYCLGHKEFVKNIEILPNNYNYLISTSGDGTVKLWDYVKGQLCHTIDTNDIIDDENLKEVFIKQMDSEGVEIKSLPIVAFAVTKVNKHVTLIAIALHGLNIVFIYNLNLDDFHGFSHKLEYKLKVEKLPSSLLFFGLNLYLYDISSAYLTIYNMSISEKMLIEFNKNIVMFGDVQKNIICSNKLESIKVLYKRKFDNVHEYQERKKQRLELKNKDNK
ncbi:tRNA (guanine-N(7)-)-methyltransferase non-catalytic subunit wuho [Bombyx mori]|uniref:tRNA (guanine-N(7)-)-methyltransferase non-catalytic subunit wuho n=1 Tax=Bombyx mori TaxID=7091 RepID=A0A8R1WLZ2_BOMMO|nr:tRNA (guanine-N(7)-)-methyltransferase non-catalytic subunit wuho [Bombyx mori]